MAIMIIVVTNTLNKELKSENHEKKKKKYNLPQEELKVTLGDLYGAELEKFIETK